MKIYIDRCHGCGQDRGASKFLNEEICSDKMIDLVIPKLQSLGHNVLAQRPSGNLTVQQSLNWRCQQANAWGADVFISNHNNAGGGEGAEVYTYNGEQLNEAKRYLQYILDHGGKSHDGTLTHKSIPGAIKNGNDLAVIKGTSMTSMLLENFYVDTQSDCDFFSNNLEMFANALVYGITGVDIENKNNTVSTPSYIQTTPKPTPVVQTKVDVTYRVYSNGRWLPNVINLNDYAGIYGQSISGIYANTNKGYIKYRVHINNRWLPFVTDRQDYAGILGTNIDGLQMQLIDLPGHSVKYRVYVGGRWLPWVLDLDDYAGLYDQAIECIQVEVINR
jgi:hypothetical protein